MRCRGPGKADDARSRTGYGQVEGGGARSRSRRRDGERMRAATEETSEREAHRGQSGRDAKTVGTSEVEARRSGSCGHGESESGTSWERQCRRWKVQPSCE